MNNGVVVDGVIVPIPGVNAIPPTFAGGPTYAQLSPGDYMQRPTSWVRQFIIHTTKGLAVQRVVPGAGPGNRAKVVADFWRDDPTHSAAQIVADTNGDIVSLCDVLRVASYHAEGSNPFSIGIEIYQESNGDVYEASIKATVATVRALADRLLIPFQHHSAPYANRPLTRMETTNPSRVRVQWGGPTCVGIFGHRDNTRARGWGDPGDAVFVELAVAGSEPLDYHRDEDLAAGSRRQHALVARGARISIDGVVGPESMRAARAAGFARWRDVQ